MEGPVRTCLACRARRSKRALVRLVVEPGGEGRGTVTADLSARLPGRGAYVCADEQCAEALLTRGHRGLARALRADPAAVKVDARAVRTAVRRRADEETTATAAGRAPQRPRAA